MNNTINGRTPEEIKLGLEACIAGECHTKRHECPYREKGECTLDVMVDALALTQQLERERDEARNDLDTINYANTELHSAYDAMKRERDAAVNDMKHMHLACETCIHYTPGYFCPGCRSRSNWQWRGVQEVQHGTE